MSDGSLRVRRSRDGAWRVRYVCSLRDLYGRLNERFWNGQLPPTLSTPTIFPELPRFVMLRRVSYGIEPSVRRPRKGLATGDGSHAIGTFYAPAQLVKVAAYWPAQIRIISPLGPEVERRVLLHEMIHCGLWFAGFTNESHGVRFVAELERLAAAGEGWAVEQAEYYRRLM